LHASCYLSVADATDFRMKRIISDWWALFFFKKIYILFENILK